MKRVKINSRQWLIRNFFHVEEVKVQFEKFDGTMSAEVQRLHLERGDAAGVLLYHTGRKTLILVEQFRYGAWTKGDGWLTEIATGKIDEGEKPEEAVVREAMEETGYQISNPEFITRFYSMPGGSSEALYIYYAEVNDSMKVAEGGGIDTEHEDVRIVEIPAADIQTAIKENKDAKTLIALQWWLANSA